jgi:hypothetical protein
VPPGSSRLRLTVMATHRAAELRHAARLIGASARELGVPGDGAGAAGGRRARLRRGRLTGLRGVFVTGTGTEVGKTVVAAAIARGLAASGRRVAVFKPCLSGLDESGEPDHLLLRRAAGSEQGEDEIAPYRFRPRSPPTSRRSWPGSRSTPGFCSLPPAGRRREGMRSSARGSAGCSCRSPRATWCATSPASSSCRW